MLLSSRLITVRPEALSIVKLSRFFHTKQPLHNVRGRHWSLITLLQIGPLRGIILRDEEASKKYMKIAVFGDIHGNIEGVQGNYDETVANNAEHCGCKYEDALQAEMAQLSFEWTKQHASTKSKKFMKTLPAEMAFTSAGKRVKLFHATPHKNNLYWYEDRPEKFFQEMAEKADADVLVYGHAHKPYKKDFNGKTFINTGSVGKPKDGDPRACVAVIEITSASSTADFLRVKYDVEKVAQAIISSGLPPYFAERLKIAQ